MDTPPKPPAGDGSDHDTAEGGFSSPYAAYLAVMVLAADSLSDAIEHQVAEENRYQAIRDAMAAAGYLRKLADGRMPTVEQYGALKWSLMDRHGLSDPHANDITAEVHRWLRTM